MQRRARIYLNSPCSEIRDPTRRKSLRCHEHPTRSTQAQRITIGLADDVGAPRWRAAVIVMRRERERSTRKVGEHCGFRVSRYQRLVAHQPTRHASYPRAGVRVPRRTAYDPSETAGEIGGGASECGKGISSKGGIAISLPVVPMMIKYLESWARGRSTNMLSQGGRDHEMFLYEAVIGWPGDVWWTDSGETRRGTRDEKADGLRWPAGGCPGQWSSSEESRGGRRVYLLPSTFPSLSPPSLLQSVPTGYGRSHR